jgi:hypothetical protein
MLGKMNLRNPVRTAIGAGVAVILLLAMYATAEEKSLIGFVQFFGVLVLFGSMLAEKSLRNFAVMVSVVLICGAGADALLNQAMFVALVIAVTGALALGSLFASPRWKPAAFLGLRIVLVGVVLCSFTTIGMENKDLIALLIVWTAVGLFWAWRKLVGPGSPPDKWRANRNADGTWRA